MAPASETEDPGSNPVCVWGFQRRFSSTLKNALAFYNVVVVVVNL
jgi:hypothetical protein